MNHETGEVADFSVNPTILESVTEIIRQRIIMKRGPKESPEYISLDSNKLKSFEHKLDELKCLMMGIKKV